MLVISGGPGLSTLNHPHLEFELAVPKTEALLELGIFDGDTGGAWDFGSQPLRYSLYADPKTNGSETTLLSSWSNLSGEMDNQWYTVSLPNAPEARAPSGHFFYRLRIENPNPNPISTFVSCFMVRVRGAVALPPQIFGMMASALSLSDIQRIYPAYPALTPSTYPGEWHFHLDVPTSTRELTVWDGDLDHGNYDRTEPDTDDPNTPNDLLPPWTNDTAALFEGVAVGYQGATGNPPDDYAMPVYVRTGAVTYAIEDPDGIRYPNPNPSGESEWERFVIAGQGANVSADLHAERPLLPHGEYDVLISGMDLTNLNAWHFNFDAVGGDRNGNEVIPPRPYLVGDTVWLDSNRNGVQDTGEAGLAGVHVELLDSNGELLDEAVTDAAGHYAFEVKGRAEVPDIDGVDVTTDGLYTVRIAADNLAANGALRGYSCTSGPLELTATIETASDLHCRFGFDPGSTLGGRVWHDLNGGGTLDADEPGFAGVTVRLRLRGAVTAVATTQSDGSYRFEHLEPGTYTVEVATETLPPGASIATYDFDGLTSQHTATVVVRAGDMPVSINFGYARAAMIGDSVWSDCNANGIQDANEPAVPGVKIRLLGATGALIKETISASDGRYRFDGLLPAVYSLQFLKPAGFAFSPTQAGSDPSRDSDPSYDGIVLPFRLLSGQARTDLDAGLVELGSIGDLVWNDYSADGVPDLGRPSYEVGLPGVEVRLLQNGTLLRTTTTGPNGTYLFSNLMPGTYTVAIKQATLPGGMIPTYDQDGTATPRSTLVVLGAGEALLNVDFGFVRANTTGCFTTYSQCSWGAKPRCDSAGSLLASKFDRVFPRGLRIGGRYTLTFTSAADVERFLPQGGSPGVLRASAIDPVDSTARVLGGQLVALQLNVSFSDCGITRNGLAEQVVASGRLAGYSVRQVLSLTNRVVGGETSQLPPGMSLTDLNVLVSRINEAYEPDGFNH